MPNETIVRLRPATTARLRKVVAAMTAAHERGHVYADPPSDRFGFTLDHAIARLLEHYEAHARRRRH